MAYWWCAAPKAPPASVHAASAPLLMRFPRTGPVLLAVQVHRSLAAPPRHLHSQAHYGRGGRGGGGKDGEQVFHGRFKQEVGGCLVLSSGLAVSFFNQTTQTRPVKAQTAVPAALCTAICRPRGCALRVPFSAPCASRALRPQPAWPALPTRIAGRAGVDCHALRHARQHRSAVAPAPALHCPRRQQPAGHPGWA